MNMDQIIREEARLVILKALGEQSDGRFSSELLRLSLETYGITKTRDWVHDELRWLADMGAIRVQEVGTVRVASLLAKGRDHVERRLVIEGVKRPGLPET